MMRGKPRTRGASTRQPLIGPSTSSAARDETHFRIQKYGTAGNWGNGEGGLDQSVFPLLSPVPSGLPARILGRANLALFPYSAASAEAGPCSHEFSKNLSKSTIFIARFSPRFSIRYREAHRAANRQA